jgi:hypothetical protein
MATNITQAVNCAFGVPEQHKVLTQHPHSNRLAGNVFTLFSGIPEIDEHPAILQA